MKVAQRAKRPSEDDVIVLSDDSDSEQPPMKSTKRGPEPVPFSEVAELKRKVFELKKKLSKSEDKLEDAFKFGREARQRAAKAEKQLRESAWTAVERKAAAEMRREFAEVKIQLEKTTRNERQLLNNNSELVREKGVLIAEVADLKRTVGQGTKDFITMQQKVTLLEAERRRDKEERARDRAITDQLMYQLGQYQQLGRQQQYPAADWHWAQQQQQQQCTTAAASVHLPAKVVKIYDNEHPTNILQLYRAGTVKSVGLDSALAQLKAKYSECGEEKLHQYLRAGGNMELACEVCEGEYNKFDVLAHFLSTGHVEKVRAHGAAVSLAAYQYWLRLLQDAAAPAVPVSQLIYSETLGGQPQSLLQLQLQPPQSILQLQLQPPQTQDPTVTAPVYPPAKVVRIYDIEHPTNILQLQRAGMLKSVGLDSALWQLKAKFNECGFEKLYLQLRIGGYMTFDCEVCETKLDKYDVLRHFFSLGHIEKVRAHGAAVSLAAYQYWLRLLQEAATAPVEAAAAAVAAAQLTLAAPAAQEVAAAAPSGGIARSLEEVKKEEPVV